MSADDYYADESDDDEEISEDEFYVEFSDRLKTYLKAAIITLLVFGVIFLVLYLVFWMDNPTPTSNETIENSSTNPLNYSLIPDCSYENGTYVNCIKRVINCTVFGKAEECVYIKWLR